MLDHTQRHINFYFTRYLILLNNFKVKCRHCGEKCPCKSLLLWLDMNHNEDCEPSHTFGGFVGSAVSVARLSIFLMVNINLWKLVTSKFKYIN